MIGTLLVVGFVLKYWWLIALVLAAVAVWKHGPGWWARHQATVATERRRLAAIAARAGQHSHLLVLLPIEWPEQEPYRTCYRD